MTYGLEKDPVGAIKKTVDQIFNIQVKNNLPEKFKGSIAYSNGVSSYAVKISTIKDQPSLYYVRYNDMLNDLGLATNIKYDNSYIVLSEPLIHSDSYKYVDNNSAIKITNKEFKLYKI